MRVYKCVWQDDEGYKDGVLCGGSMKAIKNENPCKTFIKMDDITKDTTEGLSGLQIEGLLSQQLPDAQIELIKALVYEHKHKVAEARR